MLAYLLELNYAYEGVKHGGNLLEVCMREVKHAYLLSHAEFECC